MCQKNIYTEHPSALCSVNTINLKHEQKCELKRANKNCHVLQKKLIRIKWILGDCSLAAIGFVNLVSRFCRFLDLFVLLLLQVKS